MTAKEYVQQIEKLDAIIRNKATEIRLAGSLGIDASVAKNERQQAINTRQGIIDNMQKLAAVNYDVLHKIYVQGATLYEVASDMGKSYSYVTKLHGWALQALSKIINER